MVANSKVRIRFVGCGDAFGSGGRLQTCLCVEGGGYRFLIDCGATALVGMKKFGVDPTSLDCVLVSHIHGDHYAGIPWVVLERAVMGREEPLTILGPEGLVDRLPVLTEHLFPGSSRFRSPFPLEVLEYQSMWETFLGPLTVTAYPVTHVPATNPHALRVEFAGKVIAYSGDTSWNSHLLDVAAGADIFICEAFDLTSQGRIHMDVETLRKRRDQIECERIVLTHMGDDVLRALPIEGFEHAEDGGVLEV